MIINSLMNMKHMNCPGCTDFSRKLTDVLAPGKSTHETREGVQSSSNSNHRHPNLFCGKRVPQLVITVKFSFLWFEFNALLTQFSTSIGVLWHLY